MYTNHTELEERNGVANEYGPARPTGAAGVGRTGPRTARGGAVTMGVPPAVVAAVGYPAVAAAVAVVAVAAVAAVRYGNDATRANPDEEHGPATPAPDGGPAAD